MTYARKTRPGVTIAGVKFNDGEFRVLRAMVVDGLESNREIAAKLCLSPYTIDGRIKDMRRKLGVHSRMALAIWAVRQGVA